MKRRIVIAAMLSTALGVPMAAHADRDSTTADSFGPQFQRLPAHGQLQEKAPLRGSAADEKARQSVPSDSRETATSRLNDRFERLLREERYSGESR